MTDHEHHAATHEAISTVAHGEFHSHRYAAAMTRYIAAISYPDGPASHGETASRATTSQEHATRPVVAVTKDPVRSRLKDVRVRDVMTSPAITVGQDTTYKDIVDTLTEYRISSVPVLGDTGTVVGIVTESDLLAHLVAGDSRPRRIGGPHATRSGNRKKATAQTAAELMSSPVVAVAPESSIVDAARNAARAHVRRLPVVDADGNLVGVVTRSDLLRVFLRDDEDIRRDIVESVVKSSFALDPGTVVVKVDDGMVTLSGKIESKGVEGLLVETVRKVAGVVGVDDRMITASEPTRDTPFPLTLLGR